MRPAPRGWTHAKSIDEAKHFLATGLVEEASFDHDLGACAACVKESGANDSSIPTTCPHMPTGHDLCAWLVETGHWPQLPPHVHSANVIGAAQMRGIIAGHWRPPGSPAQPIRASAAHDPTSYAADRDELAEVAGLTELGQRTRHVVLIVEDDADTRAFLSALLLANGYRVVTAANGAEALAEIRFTRPSLILLDLMMPAVSGADFRRQQVANPAHAKTPVICISGMPDAQKLASSLAIPDCYSKPIDQDQLLKAIARHCSQSARGVTREVR